ncbi:hypothetical protein [Shinella sp.]|jgi:hypothetical protein|uniref:hypothetical protein n=1 Tax=Shinella sp. TaxID=1870904 RepID=UPI003F718881
MAELLPFRVHFDCDDVAPYDTSAIDAADARKRAEAARPGVKIGKVKLVRENAHG